MASDPKPKRRKKYLDYGEEFILPKSTARTWSKLTAESAADDGTGCTQQSSASTSGSAANYEHNSSSSEGEFEQCPLPSASISLSSASEQNTVIGSEENLSRDFSPQACSPARSETSCWEVSSHSDLSSDSRERFDTESFGPLSPCTVENLSEEEESAVPDPRSPVPSSDDLITRCAEEFGNSTLPHSSTTKVAAVAMIMSFVSAHGLTWSALDDLLHMINLFYGKENVIPGSKYMFRNLWAPRTKALITKHYYCDASGCSGLLEKEGVSANQKGTKCNAIYSGSCLSSASNFFTLLDLKKQVQHTIERHKEGISKAMEKGSSGTVNTVTDITSGEAYRCLKEKGILKDSDLTLTVSTDGSPVFKSSRSAIWPIQFCVNELPPRERLGKTALGGLWFGKKHPDMHLFMGKFAKMVATMEPIQWEYGGVVHISTVHLICCSADAPARAAVQNHVLYSGYFGCPWCFIKGKHAEGKSLYSSSQPLLVTMLSVMRCANSQDRIHIL